MSNISQFTSKASIEEQACEWISKIDRGLDATERQNLKVWLHESQSHVRALHDFAKLWDSLSALNELSGLFPLRQQRQEMGRLKRLTTQARWSIAAGVTLMVVASAMMVNWTAMLTDPVVAQINSERVSTAIGEQKNVTLSDGSIVHLNTNTDILVSYSNQRRDIELLRGEAHFTVAKDAQRPFTVAAGDNTVTAVGTAFNMQYVADKAFELVVTEGRVLVKDKAATVNEDDRFSLITANPVKTQGLLMFSGEKAHVQGNVSDRHNLTELAIEDDLAWQQGMIVFKGEPLQQVLAEIGRYTQIQFKVNDEALRRQRVAGYFKVGDIDGLLYALNSSFNIEHERLDATTIRLTAAN